MRTIIVPSGIGDSIWIQMKLINSGEKFHICLPDGQPQRGKQIWDMLPQLTESCTYIPNQSYTIIDRRNAVRLNPHWRKLKANKFYLSANKHLENGYRIEKFLSDLPTRYILDYTTTLEDMEQAATYFDGGKTIGIYCSAYSNTRQWNMWGVAEWVAFIKLIHAQRPECRFLMIGAEYDLDLSTQIMDELMRLGIPHVSSVGEPLPVVVEILKKLDYFAGFPSGLSILNETLGKPGLMFYPPNLSKMMNAWAHPERIAKGEHIPLQKDTPTTVLATIEKRYKLIERL